MQIVTIDVSKKAVSAAGYSDWKSPCALAPTLQLARPRRFPAPVSERNSLPVLDTFFREPERLADPWLAREDILKQIDWHFILLAASGCAALIAFINLGAVDDLKFARPYDSASDHFGLRGRAAAGTRFSGLFEAADRVLSNIVAAWFLFLAACAWLVYVLLAR